MQRACEGVGASASTAHRTGSHPLSSDMPYIGCAGKMSGNVRGHCPRTPAGRECLRAQSEIKKKQLVTGSAVLARGLLYPA